MKFHGTKARFRKSRGNCCFSENKLKLCHFCEIYLNFKNFTYFTRIAKIFVFSLLPGKEIIDFHENLDILENYEKFM